MTAKVSAALVALQADVGSVRKSGKNKEFNYTFASLEDWTAKLRPLLAKHGLAIAISYADVHEAFQGKTKSGATMRYTRLRATGRLIHSSGEYLEFDAFGEGGDTQDKGVYKAMTGARKYLLAAVTGAATSDDAERDRPQQRPAQPPAQSAPAKGKAAAKGKPETPADDSRQSPEAITFGNAKALWAAFRTRCAQVAPDATKDDVEALGRAFVQSVIGIDSFRLIPQKRHAEFGKLIAAWLPPDAVGSEDEAGWSDGDENEGPDAGGYGG